MTREAPLQEALRLPRRERIDVAAELLTSLDAESADGPKESREGLGCRDRAAGSASPGRRVERDSLGRREAAGWGEPGEVVAIQPRFEAKAERELDEAARRFEDQRPGFGQAVPPQNEHTSERI